MQIDNEQLKRMIAQEMVSWLKLPADRRIISQEGDYIIISVQDKSNDCKQ